MDAEREQRFCRYVRAAQMYIYMLNVEHYDAAIVNDYTMARAELERHNDVPNLNVAPYLTVYDKSPGSA